MKTSFIIGVGGTGMRCLESFVHLCAMGMFDDTEIHMLALDTDLENGNFVRLQEIVHSYIGTKGPDKQRQFALKDTFFSSKINFYKFSPDYSRPNTETFATLTGLASYPKANERDLAKLLFTEEVQSFELLHGYRAQTNLGSMLMYHAIIDDIMHNQRGDLSRFSDALFFATESTEPARLFILGSVFGGTGASSIPVMPAALDHATSRRHGRTLDNLYRGAILLTNYFTFPSPTPQGKVVQKIITDARNFAMNSQAAMMFYEDDGTVRRAYQKFYLLGTPNPDSQMAASNAAETITGGAAQKNAAHYIELLAAFAASDFFKTPSTDLSKIKEKAAFGANYYFRTIDKNGRLDFSDFSGKEDEPAFRSKFTCLTAMSFLVALDNTDFYARAQRGDLRRQNIQGYEAITDAEKKALIKYFQYFHFSIDDGRVIDGWLRQTHRSAGGGNAFMFNPEIFRCTTLKDFSKLDYGKIVSPNSDYARHNISRGLLGFMSNPFNDFMDIFVKRTHDHDDYQNRSEKLIKRMYDSLMYLYNFN